MVGRGRSDEFEALKNMVHDLQAKVESLEARVATLETGLRTV
jgi:BMFP domain-containing protein YqiC